MRGQSSDTNREPGLVRLTSLLSSLRKAEKGEEGLDEWGFYGSKKKKTGVFRG
jgi:hypothetical protein